MARKIIGIDWAASGLKIAVRGESGMILERLPWIEDRPEPPPVGSGEPTPLQEFVGKHRLRNHCARVVVQRRDVLMISFRGDEESSRVRFPPPLAGWRWKSISFDGGLTVLVAIEERRIRSLESYLLATGIRLESIVLVLDPHGNETMTVDVGLNEARVISRERCGKIQILRCRPDIQEIVNAIGSTSVRTLHLTGGGSSDKRFSDALKQKTGCEVLAPSSLEDALYLSAQAAAMGSGLEIWSARLPSFNRDGTWSRVAAALAFLLAFGSRAVAGRVEKAAKNRPIHAVPMINSTQIHLTRPSTVLVRALKAIPPGVTLMELDLDATSRSLTIEGFATAHGAVTTLAQNLTAASFKRSRCVKATVDENRRVRFSVVAEYES